MKPDHLFSRLFTVLSILVVTYWCYNGVVWVWDWYQSSGGYSPAWWPQLGAFLWRNLGIVVAVYVIICLQASGVAELRFRKNFLKAFGLSLILTPPGMMIVYGHRP